MIHDDLARAVEVHIGGPIEFVQDLRAFPAGVAEDLTQGGLGLRHILWIGAAHVGGGENKRNIVFSPRIANRASIRPGVV